MESPARDLADALEAAGVGVKGSAVGWGLFRAHEPASPDTAITLYDVGGQDPDTRFRVDRPNVQIRVRGAPNDYEGGYAKLFEARDVLLNMPAQTINGTVYSNVQQRGGVTWLGYDESERPRWTLNFRMTIRPPQGAHRLPVS